VQKQFIIFEDQTRGWTYSPLHYPYILHIVQRMHRNIINVLFIGIWRFHFLVQGARPISP